MPALDDPVGDVATALAAIFAGVDGVADALDHEPLKATRLPMVSVMFSGFARSSLGTPEVRAPIGDALGERSVLWTYTVRLWAEIKSDAAAVQRQVGQLAALLIRAIEDDVSLGGIATEAKLVTGQTEVVRPAQGQPMLMLSCECLVEVDEPT